MNSSAAVSSLHLAAGAPPSAPSRVQSTPNGSHRRELVLEPLSSLSNLSDADAQQHGPPPPSADVDTLVRRLKQPPLTGQVAAWAWGEAAALSLHTHIPSVALLAALWPATVAVASAAKFTPQDVVDVVEAWATLLHRWPRHFGLSPAPLAVLTASAFPAAVKRMDEARLARIAQLCADIALHRGDASVRPAGIFLHGGTGGGGASARDLVQPIFGLVAAEVAWRVEDPTLRVSPATVHVLLRASPAWRWSVVPHRDTQLLAALKWATQAALAAVRHAIENGSAAQGRGCAP